MMANVDEYWAEGTQSWFDASLRSDVNSGINTRVKLKAHDPHLAAVLAEVYGDGPWRYGHTSAKQFGDTPSLGFTTAVAAAFPYAADQPGVYVAAQQQQEAWGGGGGGGYGAPPPQQGGGGYVGYGAPPPQQGGVAYGAPPPQQGGGYGGYGAPPPHAGGGVPPSGWQAAPPPAMGTPGAPASDMANNVVNKLKGFFGKR